MRLLALQVKNFRVLRHLDVRFADRVIGVIGPNGSGKSSLIEAISWALYGNQAARSGRDEIRSSFAGRFDACQVTLDFEVNDQTYRVVRRLTGRSDRPEVELFRGQRAESVGVNETKRYVGELLGLDWRGFLTSFLARQQELNALSDLQPARRRDQLAGMLGIERLDLAIRAVKDDARQAGQQVAFLERHLAERSTVDQRIEELNRLITGLTAKLSELETRYRRAEGTLAAASDRFLEMQQKRNQWLEIRSQAEAAGKTVSYLAEHLSRLNEEVSRLKESETEAGRLADELKEYPECRRRHQERSQARSRLELQQAIEKQQKQTEQQARQIQARLDATRKRLVALDRPWHEIPQDLDDQLRQDQRRLDESRTEFTSAREKRASLQSQLDRVAAQMDSIAQLGPESVCDRCLRPLGDSLPRIRRHLEREQRQLAAERSDWDSRLQTIQARGDRLKEACSEKEKLVTRREQLRVEREVTAKEEQELAAAAADLLSRGRELTGQLNELVGVSFDERQFHDLSVRLEQLERLRSRHDQIRGMIARLPKVRQEIESVSAGCETARAEEAQLRDTVAGLEFSETAFTNAEESFQQARQKHDTAREEYSAATRETELWQKELDGKLEQLKRFEQAGRELEESRSSQFHGEKLAGLMSAYRSVLITSIRPTLADISSRLIGEMTDGRYSLAELDEKYNLRLMDYGQYFAVERFSGGEKDLANLCLRLAISLALTDSAGLDRSFIILDEVFGSQDTERKELIIKSLTNLRNRFPQILLVTHVEDIRDRVEELIEMMPTGNGWSEVRVNGQLA